jgi:hypothetical protein
MKILICIAVIAGLELYFGINETGGKIALMVVIWAAMAAPVSLAFGEFCRRGPAYDGDGPWMGFD